MRLEWYGDVAPQAAHCRHGGMGSSSTIRASWGVLKGCSHHIRRGTMGGWGKRTVIGGEEGGVGEEKGWENKCWNIATLCGRALQNDVISSDSDRLQPVLIGSKFPGFDGNRSWCLQDFDETGVGSSVPISYFWLKFGLTLTLESDFWTLIIFMVRWIYCHSFLCVFDEPVHYTVMACALTCNYWLDSEGCEYTLAFCRGLMWGT